MNLLIEAFCKGIFRKFATDYCNYEKTNTGFSDKRE